jgi:hypothetical protein
MIPLRSPHVVLLLGALAVSGLSGAQSFQRYGPSTPRPPPVKQVQNPQEFTEKLALLSAAPDTAEAIARLRKLFPGKDTAALVKELSFLSKNTSRPIRLPRWPVELRFQLGEKRGMVISSDPFLSQSAWGEDGWSMTYFLFPHQQKDREASLTTKSLQRLCDVGRPAKGSPKQPDEVQVMMRLEQLELNPTHPYAERVLAQTLPSLHSSDKVKYLEKEMSRLKLSECALRDWFRDVNP